MVSISECIVNVNNSQDTEYTNIIITCMSLIIIQCTQLVGDHFIIIIAADEQSPRWVDCDALLILETTVTNAAKELSTSSEHGT